MDFVRRNIVGKNAEGQELWEWPRIFTLSGLVHDFISEADLIQTYAADVLKPVQL